MGELALARDEAFIARAHFESALTHFPNHPSAIVGLSTVLLDIYSEKLLPPPVVPQLDTSGPVPEFTLKPTAPKPDDTHELPCTPLGLHESKPATPRQPAGEEEDDDDDDSDAVSAAESEASLTGMVLPPYKVTSLPLVDRLAARDRAYGLLSGLTRLGTGWNYAEAWFAIARALEESGEVAKAKDALWWCVELEEGRGVRGWSGGYIIV